MTNKYYTCVVVILLLSLSPTFTLIIINDKVLMFLIWLSVIDKKVPHPNEIQNTSSIDTELTLFEDNFGD